MSEQSVETETAQLLRDLLGMVEAGELSADSSQARRLLRRIEGAIVALEATHDHPSE